MTKEDKELLLKDLCSRLPYGVICKNRISGRTAFLPDVTIESFMANIEFLKPYLRPMSNMTEEERKEYIEYAGYEIEESVNGRHYEYYLKDFCGTPDNPSVNTNSVDWLNKNMFDFRGLISKGLAIEVTEDNNPYEN